MELRELSSNLYFEMALALTKIIEAKKKGKKITIDVIWDALKTQLDLTQHYKYTTEDRKVSLFHAVWMLKQRWLLFKEYLPEFEELWKKCIDKANDVLAEYGKGKVLNVGTEVQVILFEFDKERKAIMTIKRVRKKKYQNYRYELTFKLT